MPLVTFNTSSVVTSQDFLTRFAELLFTPFMLSFGGYYGILATGSIASLEILKEVIYLSGVFLRFRTSVVNGDTGHESAAVFAGRLVEYRPW